MCNVKHLDKVKKKSNVSLSLKKFFRNEKYILLWKVIWN